MSFPVPARLSLCCVDFLKKVFPRKQSVFYIEIEIDSLISSYTEMQTDRETRVGGFVRSRPGVHINEILHKSRVMHRVVCFIIPPVAPPKVECGVYWDYPDVGPSVRSSFRNFCKNYWLSSFHTWHLPLWGESLDPYSFSCSSISPFWWPNICPKNIFNKVVSDQSGGILSSFMGTACFG